MEAPSKFSWPARFVGRKLVQGGGLNDIGLSLVVTDLQGEAKKRPEGDLRCNLEFADKTLLVTYIKRDEGFESDGDVESTKSSSTEEVNAPVNEEKIIKDHVFIADSSSGNGSDSDEAHAKAGIVVDSSSGTSSQSASPTSDLAKYKFDHKEAFNIGDVVICHTDREFRNCVVWVVKASKGLEAVVFECSSEEEVKEVYRKFSEVSKRSKLERHRRRKSDGGSVVTRSVEALFGRGRKGDKTKSVLLSEANVSLPEKAASAQQQLQKSTFLDGKNGKSWNLVQHTDRNGVTHIEVESSSSQQPMSLVGDHKSFVSLSSAANNNVSSSNSSSPKVLPSKVKARTHGHASAKSGQSKFAKELESILSKELETRKDRGGGDINEPPSPSPLIVSSSSPSPSPKGGAIPRVQRSNGESLSLRQRAPALLLKKLDEFEEKAQRVWAKAEAEEENRKVWSKPDHQPSKAAMRTPPSKRHQENWKQQFQNSPSLSGKLQDHSLSYHNDSHHHHHHSPTTVTVSSSVATPSPSSSKNKDSPAQQSEKQTVLVPTKTGKEPVKKLYPKESNPDLMRGANVPNRFVHVGLVPQMQFAGQQFSAQPHSLPIYPVQLTHGPPAPIAWARYPAEFSDPGAAANVHQMLQAQWAAATRVAVANAAVIQQGGAVAVPQPAHGGGARGRSRDRSRSGGVDPDQRRRAQSKSPARTGKAKGDGGNISTDLSRKFRVFSDAVRQKMSRRSSQFEPSQVSPGLDVHTAVPQAPTALKSNLKKSSTGSQASHVTTDLGGVTVSVSSGAASGGGGGNAQGDNKKVHFNKFATVQMME